MGLERTAAIMQGKTSIYETDLFTPLLKRVSELTGKKYGTDEGVDNAMRVVAEHSRGITFLIGDGVMPSNEGRGYVLRRLLRRAALFGRRLGLDKPFLAETARATIEQMKHVYPGISQRQDFILKVIELEEAGFAETLNTGLALLDGIMGEAASQGKTEISGQETFKLYDTYGFPVELTTEIAAGRGFFVDLEGFEREMERQRERARAVKLVHKETLELKERTSLHAQPHRTLSFVGYNTLKHKSVIVFPERIQEGQKASVILADTPFYGEMGGQIGDTGEIHSPSGKFIVTNTIRDASDIILHQGHVTEGNFTVGDEVVAEVDRERRLDIARNHTATHLLQAALRRVLGEHIQQRGSLVAPDRLRFDFSHLTAMTREEIGEVQHIVNDRIRQDLAVYDEDIAYEKAIAEGAIALFDEKYADVVRLLRIGRPHISAELCGGTHVASTGEIGFFHILSESSIGAGLRRIEAITGGGAEEYVSRRLADLEKIAKQLESESDEIVDKAQSLSAELKNERKRVQSLESQLAKRDAESIEGKVREVGGIKVLAERVAPTSIDNLREMSDVLRNKLGNAVVVLGTVWENKPAFVASTTLAGYDAGEIVRVAAAATGGSGGGKKTLAQGGGKDISKIDEALKQVLEYIEGKES
jgi:alanyl-tRNA synthetase